MEKNIKTIVKWLFRATMLVSIPAYYSGHRFNNVMGKEKPYPYENDPNIISIDNNRDTLKVFTTDSSYEKDSIPIHFIKGQDTIKLYALRDSLDLNKFYLTSGNYSNELFINSDKINLPENNFSRDYSFEDRISHIDTGKKILLLLMQQNIDETIGKDRSINNNLKYEADSIYHNNVINLTGLTSYEIKRLANKFKEKSGSQNIRFDFAMFTHHALGIMSNAKHKEYIEGVTEINKNYKLNNDVMVTDSELFSSLKTFGCIEYGLLLGCQNNPEVAKYFTKGCFMPAIFTNKNRSEIFTALFDYKIIPIGHGYLQNIHDGQSPEEAVKTGDFYHNNPKIPDGYYKKVILNSGYRDYYQHLNSSDTTRTR